MSNSDVVKFRGARKSKTFTDRYIKSLKPESKMYQVREGRGFAIRVLPSGVKTWYYVYQLNGKRRQLNLGNYPATTLEDAHKSYRGAFDIVKKGIDPQGLPYCAKDGVADPSCLSISDLAERYLEYVHGHIVPLSVIQKRRILEKHVIPIIGDSIASKFRRCEAIQLVENIAQKTPGQARNVIKTARAMFSYALERDWVEHNPFSGVGRAVPATAARARGRILSEREIRLVWSHLTTSYIGRVVLLILMTGQRPGEVVGMKWEEIDGMWWNLPGSRTKNGRDNRIYLSYLARQLLPCQIEGEDFVFPAMGRGRGLGATGSLRPGSLSHFITDNEYFSIPRWTPHDLRRTMATQLARLGCPDEVIDEILNHKKKGVISIYNKYRYDSEKRRWLILLAKNLRDIYMINYRQKNL